MISLGQPEPVSNLRIMRALIAKDWRLFRLPIAALLVAELICYGTNIISVFLSTDTHNGAIENLCASLFYGGWYALLLTNPLAAPFGGVAIAAERNDRTADFTAVLPLTRKQIILSKWIVSAATLFGFAIFHVAVMAAVLTIASSFEPHAGQIFREDLQSVFGSCGMALLTAPSMWMSYTLCFFGSAWLLSTCVPSPSICTCVAIGIPLATLLLIDIEFGDREYSQWREVIEYALPPLVIGGVTVISGALYYLKRVAP